MKILILGDRGNMGWWLREAIIARGWSLANWEIPEELETHSSQAEKDAGVVGVPKEVDVADPRKVYDVVEATCPGVVVNLASLVGSARCYAQELLALRENYTTARSVASVLQGFNVRLVHLGTTASFANDGQWIPEESPTPGRLLTSYSLTKLMGEQAVKHIYQGRGGLTIVRPVFCYGGRLDFSSVVSHILRDTPGYPAYLNPDKKKSLTWMGDLVGGLITIMEKGDDGEYNLGDSDYRPYGDTLKILWDMGYKAGNIIWCPHQDYLGDHFVAVEKARKLGWEPKVKLEEGLWAQRGFLGMGG